MLQKKTTKHYHSFAKGIEQLNSLSVQVKLCIADIKETREKLGKKKMKYVVQGKEIIQNAKRKERI